MQDLQIELREKRDMLEKCVRLKKRWGRILAKAEFKYKVERSKMIAKLNIVGHQTEDGDMKPVAITACEGMSHGIEPVATLRLKRDLAKSNYDVLQDKIFQCNLEIRLIEGEIARIYGTKPK